jgi:hypothetical protein
MKTETVTCVACYRVVPRFVHTMSLSPVAHVRKVMGLGAMSCETYLNWPEGRRVQMLVAQQLALLEMDLD